MAGGGSAESDGLASYYATRSKEPSTLVDALLLGDILRLVWHGSRRELKDDDKDYGDEEDGDGVMEGEASPCLYGA